MNYILFDNYIWRKLLPLTYTRPVAEIRMGISTMRERWEAYLQQSTSTLTIDYLSALYPLHLEDDNIFINASVIPSQQLITQIKQLAPNHAILDHTTIVAVRIPDKHPPLLHTSSGESLLMRERYTPVPLSTPCLRISHITDIFTQNAQVLQADFARICHNRQSMPLSASNRLISNAENKHNLFIEPGASIEGAILNVNTGPIYVGKNASIMEGALIRGGLAMCEHAVLKMGAKVYGATTLGPYSKVGGEVNNSVITGYSNKAHDGFLGNAVIGEWCNIGADSNNSNLKNNYGEVRMFDYNSGRMQNTFQQFVGLIMADHAKCGINTMFNTGTVVGVAANVFGGDFPPKHVPSFAWGGKNGFVTHRFDKFLLTAQIMHKRRNKSVQLEQVKAWRTVYNNSQVYRTWETSDN